MIVEAAARLARTTPPRATESEACGGRDVSVSNSRSVDSEPRSSDRDASGVRRSVLAAAVASAAGPAYVATGYGALLSVAVIALVALAHTAAETRNHGSR